MFDMLTRLCPPSLLGGIVLYGLACALWFQPLVERRLADKLFIPQCEAVLAQGAADDYSSAQRRRSRQKAVTDAYRTLTESFSGLPMMNEMNNLLEELRLPNPPDTEIPVAIDGRGVCACSVASVLDGPARFPMLLHVMSLRTYRPAILQTLPQSAAAAARSRQCGPLA